MVRRGRRVKPSRRDDGTLWSAPGDQRETDKCTLGFAAQAPAPGKEQGYITAGHCSNSYFWKEPGQTTCTKLNVRDFHSTTGDWQFVWGAPVERMIKADTGSFRSITGRRTVSSTCEKTARARSPKRPFVYKKGYQLLYEAPWMPPSFRLASAPWAALVLTLCAGCDGSPRGQGAAAANSSETPAAVRRESAFDRQAPGSANQMPALEGTPGTLRYRPGCLYLDVGDGDEIGLVVPAEVTFDGRRLAGRLTSPDGKPIIREVGRFMSFGGPVIENPRDGRYSCDTKRVLITDYF